MVNALDRTRLIGGRVLITAGLVVFVMWVRYIAWTQALPDLLDLGLLAPAVAILALGVWLAPVRGLSALIAISYRRAVVLSLAFAVVVEAVLGPMVYYLGVENPLVSRLEGLQKPGAILALAIYRRAYPQLGSTLSRDLAVAAGFAAMMAMWTCGTFAALSVLRLMRRRRADQHV